MEARRPVNVVVLLGARPKVAETVDGGLPRELINVSGKCVLHWLLQSLQTQPDDHIYIVHHAEIAKYEAFKTALASCRMRSDVREVPLFVDTRGAVETALSLLQRMEDAELARPLLTVDGNTFYEEDIVTQFREYSCNCTFYAEQPEDDKATAFSYIDFERDAAGGHNIVTRIKEKERISTHANTGAYGFGSGSELLRYCRQVIDTDSAVSTVGHQFWMSCVYELMLQDGVQVLAAEVLKYQKIRDPMRLGTFYAKFVLRSKEILRICFDLDGTLVTDPLQPGDFTTVKPLPDNIGICRQLKEQGHVIIIHTGRAMGIHSGNVGVVLKDIAKLTFDQLDEFGIPYDEIYFGKPHADVYIDGKSVNPTTEFAKTLGSLVESEEANQPRSAPGSPSSRKADDTDNDPSQYEMVEARHFNSLQFRPCASLALAPLSLIFSYKSEKSLCGTEAPSASTRLTTSWTGRLTGTRAHRWQHRSSSRH